MSWGPIIVGVDASPASACAAAVAQPLASVAAVSCQLVHAARDAWAPLAAVKKDAQVSDMQRAQFAVARQCVTDVLHDAVSSQVLAEMTIRFGPPAVVLHQVALERRPGLLVLGGKHHTALERWLGGSTSLHVVRSAELPVLITAGAPRAIKRVLVAADLSAAAGPTIGLAQRFAQLVGAELRVLTIFEPMPTLAGMPPVDSTEYYKLSEALLESDIWPLVRMPGAQKLVRHGTVVDTLLREATDWSADVLVVGSHGKGWAQRVLLGSVTESLINHLPTSLLVAPVGVATKALRKRERRQPVAIAN